MKKILFLHGFYASGQCVPAVALRAAFSGSAEVMTPDLPMHPKEAIGFIGELTAAEKPDLLMGNSCGAFYAQMVANTAGIPALLGNPHFRMTDFLKERIGGHEYKSPRKDGNQHFVIDEALIEAFAEIEPIQFDKKLAEQWKARYPGKKLVVSIGRLVPYKGYGYLIGAAARLDPGYQLLIVGDGPTRENIEKDILRNRVDDRVKLLGYVDDNEMHALLAACDVFVLSSVMKTEAFGIVQIEAMSLGKPVIATRIPESGVSWVNADGVSGINVPIKDAEALADAIRKVCTDEELHGKYSQGARNRFEEIFTLDRMIEKTIKVYNDEKNS